MPELPEVETVVRGLRPHLAGRIVATLRRHDAPPGPKYSGLERADGRRVLGVERRGKFIVAPLDGGDLLVVHLGMTGTLTPRRPADHIRVILTLQGDAEPAIYFRDPRRFGRVIVAPNGDLSALPTLAAMGPEPFDPAFTDSHLMRSLKGRRVAIKTALLGQRIVAGLGNIYVDEALWRAGIHPETPASRVPRRRIAPLREAILLILGDAIAAGGTTLRDYRHFDGDTGGHGPSLDVYGREGEPCRRCGDTLSARVVGQRTSTFCPRCQRLPRASR